MLKEYVDKLKSFKILLVEDEDSITQLIGGLFKDLDVNFKVASTGQEGLDLIQSNVGEDSFNLIIADIHMPQMDGLTMISHLKEDKIDIPVIIISALTEEEYITRAEELGVKCYLKKPFDFQRLLEVVYEL